MSELKVGDKVKVIDKTVGENLGELRNKKAVGVVVKSNGLGGNELISVRFEGRTEETWYAYRFAKVKDIPTAKPKKPTHLVTWEENNIDPTKEFSSEREARKFAKELMQKANVCKESVYIYELKKKYKVEEVKSVKITLTKY